MQEDPKLRLNPLRNAPNLLTLMRMCMAPFLVAAILEGHFLLSFILFVAAGLTDGLDGLLARLLKQRSVLGHYLDPVADKLLLSTLFLVLFYKGLMPGTVTVLVFGRDVGILLVSAILYAAVGRREFYPSIFGKANTLAQISAVAAVLLQPDHAGMVLGRSHADGRTRRDHRAYGGVGPALCLAGFAPYRNSGRKRRRCQVGICMIAERRRNRPGPRESVHFISDSSCRSSVPTVSSISISRNSSESKTSPHSRHSTYSVSSCRETIRTLGCLQAVAIVLRCRSSSSQFRSSLSRSGWVKPALPRTCFHLRVLASGYGCSGMAIGALSARL